MVFVGVFYRSTKNKIRTEISSKLVRWFSNKAGNAALCFSVFLYKEWEISWNFDLENLLSTQHLIDNSS